MSAVPPLLTASHHRHYLPLLELCRHSSEFAQLHSSLIKLGLIHNTLFSTRLAAFLSLSPSPNTTPYARRLFDRDPNPNSFAFNLMIRGHAQSSEPHQALSLFIDMLQAPNARPNSMTFPFVLKACSSSTSSLAQGCQVHAFLSKLEEKDDLFIQNALVHMYVTGGSFDDALKLFHRMPQRDAVSWNTVVTGLAGAGLVEEARELFEAMPERNVASWNCLIDGFVKRRSVEDARGVFEGMTVKDGITWNTMIGGFVSCGQMEEACGLFRTMPVELKDALTFSSMIDGYSRVSKSTEVLELFNEMLALKIEHNNFTLVCALSACARLLALEQGEWIHSYVNKCGVSLDAVLGTALLDMYAKCGEIKRALEVFDNINEKDVGAWNCIISNLGIHGRGKEALGLFFKLLGTDLKPDEVTFLSVLSACRHSGLAREGRRFFVDMSEVYGMKPKAEHFGCMVDLLCRAGLLHEAKELIEATPIKELSVAMWGALLEASSRIGNVEMGEYAAKHLLELDPRDARCYVALSNLYSRGRKWEKSLEVRKLMRSIGIEKLPGCSLIEVDDMVHEYHVGSAFNTIYDI